MHLHLTPSMWRLSPIGHRSQIWLVAEHHNCENNLLTGPPHVPPSLRTSDSFTHFSCGRLSQFLQYRRPPGGAAGELRAAPQHSSARECFPPVSCHVFFLSLNELVWKRMCQRRSSISQKCLPPSFIHPLTNRVAFWINLTAALCYLVPRKYNWVKITPSGFNPINISNNCTEERSWQQKTETQI